MSPLAVAVWGSPIGGKLINKNASTVMHGGENSCLVSVMTAFHFVLSDCSIRTHSNRSILALDPYPPDETIPLGDALSPYEMYTSIRIYCGG